MGGRNPSPQSSPHNNQGGGNIDGQLRQAGVCTGPEYYNPIHGSGYWVEQMNQKLKLMGK